MSESVPLSFKENPYTRSQFEDNSRWVVLLEDGRQVIQDDDNPGMHPSSAWLRLKEYVESNKDVKIKGMYIQFRSHIEWVGKGHDGYFFSKGAGCWALEKSHALFNVGFLRKGALVVTTWRLPELEKTLTETRDIKEWDWAIIRNNT